MGKGEETVALPHPKKKKTDGAVKMEYHVEKNSSGAQRGRKKEGGTPRKLSKDPHPQTRNLNPKGGRGFFGGRWMWGLRVKEKKGVQSSQDPFKT